MFLTFLFVFLSQLHVDERDPLVSLLLVIYTYIKVTPS